jgi:hypothetical protein
MVTIVGPIEVGLVVTNLQVWRHNTTRTNIAQVVRCYYCHLQGNTVSDNIDMSSSDIDTVFLMQNTFRTETKCENSSDKGPWHRLCAERCPTSLGMCLIWSTKTVIGIWNVDLYTNCWAPATTMSKMWKWHWSSREARIAIAVVSMW